MKVLWVTYAPLGRAALLIEKNNSQSGTWIDATANEFLKNPDIILGIASIASRDCKIVDSMTNITFFGLDEIKRSQTHIVSNKEIEKWANVINDFEPDIIMVWGTEYSNGLAVLKAAARIPVIFFIQGVIGRIIRYPLGNLKRFDIFKECGLISFIKLLHFNKVLKLQRQQQYNEIDMIKKAHGIITDNEWSSSYYRLNIPNVKIYNFPLPVNNIFLNGRHNINNIKEFSIFTIDGCNPSKGIFHLVKALAKVKNIYPDVHLYIPGKIATKKPEFLFESPYYTYLKKLIIKLDLVDNVTFCGQLTPKQMKSYLLNCNVFVMPSCIENHSSSLREAMYLGVPSISADVGSVSEFTNNGKNVLLYRYEEEDVLADSIIQIFNDNNLAYALGKNAYDSIKKVFPQDNLGYQLIKIYNEVIKNE